MTFLENIDRKIDRKIDRIITLRTTETTHVAQPRISTWEISNSAWCRRAVRLTGELARAMMTGEGFGVYRHSCHILKEEVL